jgi:POT family proton-dependent oligopeptide transporter
MNKRLMIKTSVSMALILVCGAYSLAQSSSDTEQEDTPIQIADAAPVAAPAAVPKSPTSPASEADKRRAQGQAEKLMGLLSGHVSKTAEAAPATLDANVVKALADAKMAESLADEDGAGGVVHKLRKQGFLPMKSVDWDQAWIGSTPGSVTLRGFISLVDGRFRSVEITVDGEGRVSSFTRPAPSDMGAYELIEQTWAQVIDNQEQAAWDAASPTLKANRDAATFKADMIEDRLDQVARDGKKLSIAWHKDSQIEGGFRVNGTATLTDGTALPFYGALLDGASGLQLIDIQSRSGFMDRIQGGGADSLDISLAIVALALLLAFLAILVFYVKGLAGSPKELYILFFTKVTEYSAYGAAQLAFMFYLREDIGLSDLGAGAYYSAWSTGLTLLTMVVGAVCDAIGIKRTLLIGAMALMLSRAIMPFADGIWIATLFGFVPLAFGVAITGPVLSVGIKRYTTIESCALGFGLFYTLMNVGWALGAAIFDYVRINMGEMGSVEFLGSELSTYQVILGIGFFINLPDLMAILLMRNGVEMTESGVKIDPPTPREPGVSMIASFTKMVSTATKDTVRIFAGNFAQRAFWLFILLIGITVFARLTFFHFHITWPSYGSRYFGQGSLIGNIFGVLNPVAIVFLVPVIAYLTRKVSSYWMLLIGTVISVGSIFFVVVPIDTFAWMETTWLGTVIYDRWLEVPVGFRDPYYLSMVLFVSVFTLGEAIWSPRLMQFTAEVAPPGREGSYVALAYLPYFGAKFIAGPMAGILLTAYSPEFGIDGVYMNYPDHQMIWWWVGGTAALTPIGLVLLRGLYREAEERARLVAVEAAAAEALSQGSETAE